MIDKQVLKKLGYEVDNKKVTKKQQDETFKGYINQLEKFELIKLLDLYVSTKNKENILLNAIIEGNNKYESELSLLEHEIILEE